MQILLPGSAEAYRDLWGAIVPQLREGNPAGLEEGGSYNVSVDPAEVARLIIKRWRDWTAEPERSPTPGDDEASPNR
jgi:hypothetical protein